MAFLIVCFKDSIHISIGQRAEVQGPIAPTKTLTLEEKDIVGTYEVKSGANTTRFVLLDNGVNERYHIKDFIIHGNEKKWEYEQTGNYELNILYDKIDKLHLENLSSFIVLKKIFNHGVGFVNHRIIKIKNNFFPKKFHKVILDKEKFLIDKI